jgi:hypothetical protein
MTYHFDGSTYTINISADWASLEVTVTEGANVLTLVSTNGHDFTQNGASNAAAMARAGMDNWTADRIGYCFHLAQRVIDRESMAF